jgi:hypothetical protein
MDAVSVTRPSPPSTKAIVADEGLCRQVAALLLCEPGPIHDAFVGEPVEEVLEMVRWTLSHEDDEGFDTAQVLTSWARKRGRGAWSGRPQRPERDVRDARGVGLKGVLGGFARPWSSGGERPTEEHSSVGCGTRQSIACIARTARDRRYRSLTAHV